MKVEMAEQNGGADLPVYCKLFIGGLSYTTTDDQLKSFYEQWGDVVDSIVMRDQTGRSRGFGFVTYRTKAQMEASLAALPHFLDGKTVDPKRATPKENEVSSSNMMKGGGMGTFRTSGPDIQDPQYCKLFIGGLAYTTTDEQLKAFYSQFGDITDSIVMRDSATGRSRGFGFVTYSSISMVDHAMNNRPHVVEGKTVDPKRAMPRELSTKSESNMSTKRLFVGALRPDTLEDQLKEYFETYGVVSSVEIKSDKVNPNKKFGFVQFDDYDPVDRVILSGPHTVNNKQISVQKSLSKEEQRKAQQQDRERAARDTRSRGTGRVGGGGGGDYYGGGGAGGGGGGGGWGGQQGGGGGTYGGGPGGGYSQQNAWPAQGGGGWSQQGQGWGAAAPQPSWQGGGTSGYAGYGGGAGGGGGYGGGQVQGGGSSAYGGSWGGQQAAGWTNQAVQQQVPQQTGWGGQQPAQHGWGAQQQPSWGGQQGAPPQSNWQPQSQGAGWGGRPM